MVVVLLLVVLLLECRRTVVLLECRRIFFGLMSLRRKARGHQKIDLSQCTNAAAPIIAAAATLTNNIRQNLLRTLSTTSCGKKWWCRKCQILR